MLWMGLLAVTTSYSAPLGIIVPAYFPSSSNKYWSELYFAAARVPLIVIINPNSGPGASKDNVYVQKLSKLHEAGGKIVGYVHTSYGARPMAEVKNEIDLYLSFYAVDGFFIDEMTDDENSEHINYYAAIYQYIKSKNASYTVTGNPGSNTQEHYLTKPADDRVMIFEDNGTNYSSFQPAGWVVRYSAQQFAHLPYGVKTAGDMSNYIGLAVNRNAGWVYITDDTLPNPYDTMPSYWTNEVALVQSLNKNNLAAAGTNSVQLGGQAANAVEPTGGDVRTLISKK
jgi:Spherulation-specific family 4